jgi:hypothetical protein
VVRRALVAWQPCVLVDSKTFERSSKAREERIIFMVDTDTGFAGTGW